MDIWEYLVSLSSLDSGTALDRFNSLTAGGESGSIFLVDSMNLDIDTSDINLVVSDTEELSISIEGSDLDLTITLELMELPL